MPTLDEIFAAAATAPAPVTKPYEADYYQREARAAATQANRDHKRAEKAAALEEVGGDRESLCRIFVWERLDPNNEEDAKLIRHSKYEPEEYSFAALDRKLKAEIGNDERQAMTDMSVTNDNAQYKLVAKLVPRARHYDEEVAWAKAQGRYREQKPSSATFFADPTVRVRKDRYQPLGDFNWCERNEDLTREQALTHSLAKLRAARKIRNVKEAAA